MIATDAGLLAGGGQIMAMTASGRRERATLVAIDLSSNIGLVKVADSLPVARLVDWSEVQPGTEAVEMAVESVNSGEPTSAWWDETIASAGDAVSSGPGAGMASVVATTPQGAEPDGAVLMEHNGAVVGLLDRSGMLVSEWAFSVSSRPIRRPGGPGAHGERRPHPHGWLGIKGSDARADQPKGALVTPSTPTGPPTPASCPGT